MYLKKVTHIIAHNALFDINVITSELYRYGLEDIIHELDSKDIYCSMKHTKKLVNAKNRYGKLKDPSLSELYEFACKKPIQNAHNSKYDVINLHYAMKTLYDRRGMIP